MADEQIHDENLDYELAKRLVGDKRMWEFLERKLKLPQEQLAPELATMTNSDLGELVKADILAQQKIIKRLGDIKVLATSKPAGKTIVAPR